MVGEDATERRGGRAAVGSRGAQPSGSPPSGDRKYLLERVDDAAVVQLYADGFDKLPLERKR